MQLKDVMTRKVKTVRPEDPIQMAARVMADSDVGAVPVCDGRRVMGVLTDRDIAVRGVAMGIDCAATRASDIMSPDVVYGFEEQDLSDAAREMEQRRIRRLVVVDAERNLCGIVSLADLAIHARPQGVAGEVLEHVSQPGNPVEH